MKPKALNVAFPVESKSFADLAGDDNANTLLEYRYCDNLGSSVHRTVILEGAISLQQLEQISNALIDGKTFLPYLVGLPQLISLSGEFDDGEDEDEGYEPVDHDLHTIEHVELTLQRHTEGASAEDFVEQFLATHGANYQPDGEPEPSDSSVGPGL